MMTEATLDILDLDTLKVLLVVQPTEGGAALNVLQIAQGANSDSLQISIVSPPGGFLRDRVKPLKIRHVCIDFKRQIRPLDDLRNFSALYKLLQREDFDIIHAHSSKAGFLSRIAARLAKVPYVVYTPHGFAYYQFHGISRFVYYWLERFAALLTDRIICVSPSEMQAAIHDHVTSADKLVVIENGINTDKFLGLKKGALRQLIGVNAETDIIGMVSRLSRPKRPEDLINAVEHIASHRGIKDIACVFIGSGPLELSMKQHVEHKGLEKYFHFLGDRVDVPDLLTDFDIFVLASGSEGLPYTILEAMASGLPVIGTRVKGIVDLVTSGHNGFLYDEGDSISLGELIAQLLRDADLRQAMGNHGRNMVNKDYQLGKMISKTVGLYRSLNQDIT